MGPLLSAGRAAAALALLLLPLPLSGCTTTSAVELQPVSVQVEHRLTGTVRVEATGSARRAGVGPRSISGADLTAALEATLVASALCDGVVQDGRADHVLRVEVQEAWTSEPQLDMAARVTARWSLFDGSARVLRWQDVVQTKGRATTFDADMLEDRTRMALEDAMRKNLTEGFARLGRRAELATPLAPAAGDSAP